MTWIDPTTDPDEQEFPPQDLRPWLAWLDTRSLHFQLSDDTRDPAADPAPPPRLYVGFLAIEQPASNRTMAVAPPENPTLVGDGVGTYAPAAAAGTAPPNPAGTCSIAIATDVGADVLFSVSVTDTSTHPPTERHQDNMRLYESVNPSFPVTVSHDALSLHLVAGTGPYTLTITQWSKQIFVRTRTNLLGGKFLPPLPHAGG
jgi:hypothetical protein